MRQACVIEAHGLFCQSPYVFTGTILTLSTLGQGIEIMDHSDSKDREQA